MIDTIDTQTAANVVACPRNYNGDSKMIQMNTSDIEPKVASNLRRRSASNSLMMRRESLTLLSDDPLEYDSDDDEECNPEYKWSCIENQVVPKHIFYTLAVRASSVDTSQRELIKRSTFILMCSFTVLAGLIWGCMYAILGEYFAAIMPFMYSTINGALLLSCTIEGRYEFFVRVQLCLILLLPYAVHFALGGWQESGGVMIWSFLAPLGSVFFRSSSESLKWFQVYIITTITILFNDENGSVGSFDLSGYVLRGYWLMNIAGVTIIVYFAAFLFARELELEYSRSEQLLNNILPSSIAKRIKCGELPIVDNLEGVTILFADLVGFTKASTHMNPNILIGKFLRDVFSELDKLVEKRGLEKIKTIGDAYMVVAGLQGNDGYNEHHAIQMMNFAAEMFSVIRKVNRRHDTQFEIRVGMHTGPVVAGVIGVKKFAYDVWGNAVNTASRMESHGKPSFIHLSQEIYNIVSEIPGFCFIPQGESLIKGLGLMKTYLAKPYRRSSSSSFQ